MSQGGTKRFSRKAEVHGCDSLATIGHPARVHDAPFSIKSVREDVYSVHSLLHKSCWFAGRLI